MYIIDLYGVAAVVVDVVIVAINAHIIEASLLLLLLL